MTEAQPISTKSASGPEPELNKYFKLAVKTKASDLHLKAGQPPKLRVQGSLKNTNTPPMPAEQIEKLVLELFSPQQKDFFMEHGQIDFAHDLDGENRFRINVFRQRGVISLAARRVESTIPPFEQLHLPPIVEKIAGHHQGLVLVVGATGSGKSTTIASMIDFINRTRSSHIVTVEDPIEYIFKDGKAIVSQREVGIDVANYDEALKSLMRQDPDVVLVGEMRDAVTVTAAMRAAETGHMVFGTMHSEDAPQSVQRLLDLFPQVERDLVRQTLSLCLRSIISQKLLPSIKEGVSRVPVVEVLLANATVRKLIAESREGDLTTVIKSSLNEGMQDFTYNLCELIKSGTIDPKVGFEYAPNKDELKMALKGIRASTSGLI